MRIAAMVKRIFHQMLRDKRALALMMVAPLLVLTLMNYLLSGNTVNPRLGVINADDKLKPLFGKGQISMFELAKVVNKNVK